MIWLNINGTGLLRIPNETYFSCPKTTAIKSRQIVEASDDKLFVCGNVPQTASQTVDMNSFFHRKCNEYGY